MTVSSKAMCESFSNVNKINMENLEKKVTNLYEKRSQKNAIKHPLYKNQLFHVHMSQALLLEYN